MSRTERGQLVRELVADAGWPARGSQDLLEFALQSATLIR